MPEKMCSLNALCYVSLAGTFLVRERSRFRSPPAAPVVSYVLRHWKDVPLGSIELEGSMPRNAGLMPDMSPSDWNRFWGKVDRSGGPDACWPWMAARSAQGYGRFKVDGKLWSPHRLAASQAKGGMPTLPGYHGSVVMHSCDMPGCCNPKHLTIGTNRQNVRDMFRKGRAPARRRCSVPEETLEIIRASTKTDRGLAAEVGISHSYVSRLRRRMRAPSILSR